MSKFIRVEDCIINSDDIQRVQCDEGSAYYIISVILDYGRTETFYYGHL